MQIGIAIEGRLDEYYRDERRKGARAVTTSVRRAATNLKNEMRRQTKAAGLDRNARPGRSASKTWQSKDFPPRRASLGAASITYSKFPRAMQAFVEGATITADGGQWLAIPATDAASGNRRVTPKQYGNLQFIRTRDPNVALLIERSRGGGSRVAFYLYRKVRIRRRLDYYGASEKWLDRLPGYIVNEWARLDARGAGGATRP